MFLVFIADSQEAFCGERSLKHVSRSGRKARKRVPNFSCLSTEISHSLVPSSLRAHLEVRRLLNLADRQKLLPNSICLSTRPLILRPWKKSSHFRRFSEPVSKFRRPNANRSRLRFLLVSPSCPTKSSFSFLDTPSSGYGETKPWAQSWDGFSCPSSISFLCVTRQQLVDRINGELNRFLMTRVSFSPTKHPDDNMRSLLLLKPTWTARGTNSAEG